MAKERMLTVLVPITDDDATVVSSLPAVDSNNINIIYKYNGIYYRIWLNPDTNQYEYHTVVDREFPYIGQPLEIFDFTYDAIRMGQAPTISANNVMWYAEKDANGEDITLEDKWIEYGQKCHVIFNGETLYLQQIPTSSKSNEDARYKYDINFVSEDVCLEQVYIYDVVTPFVSERPLSESSVFSFFGDVKELLNRINSSLIHSGLASLVRKYVYKDISEGDSRHVLVPYYTYKQWNDIGLSPVFDNTDVMHVIYQELGGDYNQYLMQYIYQNTDGDYVVNGYKCVIGKDAKGQDVISDEKLVSFDNNYIIDAIHQINDIFELQYYVVKEKDGNGDFTGNTLIVVGDCEHDFAEMNAAGTDYKRDADGLPTTEHPFDYGVNNELLSKEKTNTTDKIVTRMTGFGSEENIPWYYPNPTADGWIKPLFKINDVESDIGIDYPEDSGTTVDDSVLYEKYLRNRIGDVFQYGVKKNILYADSYLKNGLSGSSGGINSTIQLTYAINVKNNYTNPKFRFSLSFLKGSKMSRLQATLRDNTAEPATVVGQYDSNETYTNPTTFQSAFINADNSVSVVLTAGHVYYLYFTISINGLMPLSQRYDYSGYHYSGRDVGVTSDYNQYYPQLPQGNAYNVHIREDFYAEDELVEVGELFDYYYESNQSNIIIGYSINGTQDTGAEPLAKIQGSKYKDLNTDVIYMCTDASDRATTGFTANPIMSYSEWVDTYMRFTLSVWSVDGWYKKAKKVELSDYGLTLGSTGLHTLDITDTIEFKRLKYITPCQRLMPEVYIKTDGERRFYDAINYPRTGTPDSDIGETTGQGGSVVNPIYQPNNDGVHYDFENEIFDSQPKEYIEVYDDIKPTIKEQTNYYHLTEEPADWSTNYTAYYRKNEDGEFEPNTSSEWPAVETPTTAVYANVRIDIVEQFDYDELDNDEIWEDNDNGNVSGEYKHPFFFAKLRPLGFNIFDLALQDDMVLSMTTGHCGACNFKIGVDENTGKNPVQIWEYNVYEGADYSTKVFKYSKGTLRRYVDTTNLYYDTTPDAATPENGYIHVDGSVSMREGFIVYDNGKYGSTTRYSRIVYSAEKVLNGEVGSMKQDPKNHFEGDVIVSGKFIQSQQDTSQSFVWVALYKDIDTYGTIMPSAKPDYGDNNYSVYIDPKGHLYTDRKTGVQTELDDDTADKFVLINIRLPQTYLRFAENKLSRKIVETMNDNNYQKFNFSMNHSRIFLAQNPSVDDNLNENSVVYVGFNRQVYRQYVQHYSYKMTRDAVLPEISLDMNEELSVSRTKRQSDAVVAQRQNVVVSRQIDSMMRTVNERIMKRTVNKSDDVLVSGNIISRDAATSTDEIGVSVARQTDNIRNLNVSKEKTREFVEKSNEFNSGVSERLSRIRQTVEDRMQPYIGATQGGTCPTYRYNYDSVTNEAELLWVNTDGTKNIYRTDLSCPTSEGMTDISWADFNFS